MSMIRCLMKIPRLTTLTFLRPTPMLRQTPCQHLLQTVTTP